MQARPPRQNTDAELAAFDSTCERLAGFNPLVSFEWVDGFLASLAAAPRVPEAAEWLPAMCGDAFERAFGDPEDEAAALAALQARLKVLCDQLDPGALLDNPEMLRLDPLMAEWSDEERQRIVEEDGLSADDALVLRTGVLWAEGFLVGVEAFPALWELPAQDEAGPVFQQAFDQVEALLLPVGTPEWDTHVATYYPKGAPEREDLLAEACMSVQDLRLFWIDFAPKTATRRVEATPGRNDPCPCGSGKKYKKCHGLAVDQA